jgi:hypothetical protein
MRMLLRVCAVASLIAATVGMPSMASADREREPLAQFGTTKREVHSAASKALRAVQEARAGKSTGKAAHASRDYTLKLRDLRILRNQLSGSERAAADRMLARPADHASDPEEGWPVGAVEAAPKCGTTVCVHYVTTSSDAAESTFADTTLAEAQSVLATYAGAGYRPPNSDGTIGGGTGTLDIYLSNLGPDLFGYCTSDQNKTNPSDDGYDLWAYCVLDNDFSEEEFGGNPEDLLDVTLAHELFHAVQYAYDAYEDGWMMEATATWVEDELFDDVNDNLFYVSNSPISRPGHSLDRFEDDGYQYGVWTFFRYLTERHPTKEGDLPVLIRNIWDRADGSTENTERNDYSSASIFAVKSALYGVDSRPFRSIFADYAARNRHPQDSYEEGAAWRAYLTPARLTYTFSTSTRSHTLTSFKLAQLASQTIEYRPKNLTSSSWKLGLKVALPPPSRGSAATALVYSKSGTIKAYPITLSSKGAGSKTVSFSSSSVQRVQLVLSNAGLGYDCWRVSSPRSCMGYPLDNNLTVSFKASAFKG